LEALRTGAGGHNFQGFHLEAIHQLAHAQQGLAGALGSHWCDGAAGRQPFAQADRPLFIVKDAKLPIFSCFHHNTADGVGADIDGGDSFAFVHGC